VQNFDFSFGPKGGKRREEEPFYLGVLADLSGQPAQPLPPLASRRFLEIDLDNFDERVRRAAPRLAFQVPNVVAGKGLLDVELSFAAFEDFWPAAVTAKVELLQKLWTAREQLAGKRAQAKGLQGRPQMEQLLSEALDDAELVQAILPSAGAPQPATEPEAPPSQAPPEGLSDLDKLLGMKPGERPAQRPSSPIQHIFEEALADTPRISDEAVTTIGALIERLDELFSAQLTLVLHHDAFQSLEATWLGIDYLVKNCELDENLKIRVLNITKAELAAALQWPDWDENPLLLMMKHEPYGCLLGDYYFDHSPGDVAVLSGMARLSSTLGFPFVTAAAPSFLGLGSWRELRVTKELPGILQHADHAAWRELATSSGAQHLYLTMPRFLGRLPYGKDTNPAEGVALQERFSVASDRDFVWCNAAYGVGAVVCRAFTQDGWEARIAGGGEESMIEGLPVLTYTDKDGEQEIMCPTEVSMTVEAAALLTACGLTPLLHVKNTDRALFAYAPTLRKPPR
jgi:type VI secretion system ImpC/EvpB family protein/type VI secretion system ImpB/VipA family protein